MDIIDQVYIAEHFVTAVEYYDICGLDDQEIAQVDLFLSQYPDCSFEYIHDPQFTRDVISGLQANCVRVSIHKVIH